MNKKPARTFVIQQDEHLQNLRKIIKRDFFGDATAEEKKETLQLTLNDYISNYKSNQNQFFSEMVHVNNEQWKQNHWWIDKQDKMLMVTNNEKFLALPYHNMLETNPNQNGINTAITKQQAKNSFFFNRQNNYGSLQSSEYQSAKTVAYANCRLQDSVSEIKSKIGFVKHEQITPVRQSSRQWQNKRQQYNDQVRRQSDDGPLMTWGQIESTPLRIAGPQFRIPQTPQRQIILSNLNSKISKQKVQPPKKSEHIMKILGSLTPSLHSRNRLTSSMRRTDSVRRQRNAGKDQKSDISGLLHIKK